MVGGYRKAVAALSKKLALFQGPCNRLRFAFDGGVTSFRVRVEPGPGQADPPSRRAACQARSGALACLLAHVVTHPFFRPVCLNAGFKQRVKDLDAILDSPDDLIFPRVEGVLQGSGPLEFDFRAEELPEGLEK